MDSVIWFLDAGFLEHWVLHQGNQWMCPLAGTTCPHGLLITSSTTMVAQRSSSFLMDLLLSSCLQMLLPFGLNLLSLILIFLVVRYWIPVKGFLSIWPYEH
ncbi:hypothetical protein Pfo_024515 [Paulownia fortunei]|nr:hypothetical protein Pfo_024515 [Paulownia fortunei]